MISAEERQARSDRMKAMHAAKKEAPAVREESDRTRRNLFNGTSQRLAVIGEIDGYIMRWFNDQPGRLELALASGWEYVDQKDINLTASRRVTEANADLGSRVTAIVKDSADVPYQKAVLMKIKKEFFDQDQADAQSQIDERERQMIKRGGSGAVENAYVPKTHVDGKAIHMSRQVR